MKKKKDIDKKKKKKKKEKNSETTGKFELPTVLVVAMVLFDALNLFIYLYTAILVPMMFHNTCFDFLCRKDAIFSLYTLFIMLNSYFYF